MISEYQKFTSQVISRSQISEAPYNPRTMDAEAKKRLKKVIKKHGLVQPIVINKKNMRVVGGHQRLEALDTLEKNDTYELEVAMVDLDDKEEIEINLILNNSSITGDFDFFKVAELVQEYQVDLLDTGFTIQDINILEAETNFDLQAVIQEEVSEAVQNNIKKEPVKKENTQADYDKIDQSRKDFKERNTQETIEERNRFVVVNFDTLEEHDEFLLKNGFTVETRHIAYKILKDMVI